MPGRDGNPVERSVYGPGVCVPNCQTVRGCPKGTPEKPLSLNENMWLCWQHNKECRAIGEFPDDPVVSRNAAIIQEIEDRIAKQEIEKRHDELVQIACLKGSVTNG